MITLIHVCFPRKMVNTHKQFDHGRDYELSLCDNVEVKPILHINIETEVNTYVTLKWKLR